jgi:hypothetical protein
LDQKQISWGKVSIQKWRENAEDACHHAEHFSNLNSNKPERKKLGKHDLVITNPNL